MAVEISKASVSFLVETNAIEISKASVNFLVETNAIELTKASVSFLVNEDEDEYVPPEASQRRRNFMSFAP